MISKILSPVPNEICEEYSVPPKTEQKELQVNRDAIPEKLHPTHQGFIPFPFGHTAVQLTLDEDTKQSLYTTLVANFFMPHAVETSATSAMMFASEGVTPAYSDAMSVAHTLCCALCVMQHSDKQNEIWSDHKLRVANLVDQVTIAYKRWFRNMIKKHPKITSDDFATINFIYTVRMIRVFELAICSMLGISISAVREERILTPLEPPKLDSIRDALFLKKHVEQEKQALNTLRIGLSYSFEDHGGKTLAQDATVSHYATQCYLNVWNSLSQKK